MHKKLLAIILSVFLLSGCMGSREVPYSEGVWAYKDWENMELVVEEDCVSNKETAIAIAESIIKEFQKKTDLLVIRQYPYSLTQRTTCGLCLLPKLPTIPVLV